MANKQCFLAIGSGDLVIEIPNGVTASKLTLKDVLYSPEIGYTLVSIGKLDVLGYCVSFHDGQCTVHTPADTVLGQIPKSVRGLYCVDMTQSLPVDNLDNSDGTAAAAVPQLMVMDLH